MRRLLFLTISAACLTVSPAAIASVSVETTPDLQPAFSSNQLDYVTRCPQKKVEVKTSSSRPLSIDGRPARTGRQSRSIPLEGGQRFQLILGKRRYSVRCLPEQMVGLELSGKLPAETPFLAIGIDRLGQPGSPAYPMVVDRRGVPVWFVSEPNPVTDVKLAGRGRIGYWTGTVMAGDKTTAVFKIRSFAGRVAARLRAGGGQGSDVHEALRRRNGHWLIIAAAVRDNVDLSGFGGPAAASLLENDIQELSPSGKLLWTWRSPFTPSDSGRWLPQLFALNSSPIDVVHMNSIAEDGANLIISTRHHDAVYKVSRGGKIVWKLGGAQTDRSLRVIGDSETYPLRAQHDARLWRDGSLTIFDNRTDLGQPRVLRYRIDEAAKTATLLEQFSDPQVSGSALGGSARKTSSGTWIVSWSSAPLIAAYSPGHQRRFALRFADPALSYRAAPIGRGQLSRQQLLAGMDRQFPRR